MNIRAHTAGGDRCPGVLRPHIAADGALVRLRVPGGRVSVGVLADLLDLAALHGAPVLQLTSRGNLQLRALPDPLPESLISGLEATGLLPSASHERVRNVLASVTGPDLAVVDALVAELDSALVADPQLADLPGRFMFAVSGVDRSVVGEPYDVAYESDSGLLRVGSYGAQVADPVPAMLERARTFLRTRASDRTWNVRDLPDTSPVYAGLSPVAPRSAVALEPGRSASGELVAGVPLGMLTGEHVAAFGRRTDTVRLTPWRSVVLPSDTSGDTLLAAGLVLDPHSPMARISACVGAPSCARTASPTLQLARHAAAHLPDDVPRLHVVGCDRRCGEPASAHLLCIAPSNESDVLATVFAR